MSIRPGIATDIPAIHALLLEFATFQQTPEKLTVTIAQLQADHELFRCFVVENVAGRIVGFASYFFAYYSWSGKALYLDDLYVQEAFRQQGFGKALLEAVIEMAKAEQCVKVRWQVSNWNTPAIAFYRAMGATIDAVELNCDLALR
ncbi:GNAT family N-acetyltransferase [Flaviaesturariibacter amylovorans]|uniref:GNAT family N-acetyltransferase n=1 Tax=Flaviaesturariibacter amylovorans TaxID=1084520 RepID=A0ABP8HEM5_9BACT